MQKQIIQKKGAPAGDSPYSPAVIFDSLVFVSGQIPLDYSTNTIFAGSFEQEAELVLQNLRDVLSDAGSSIDNVLKVTVFLTNMEEFGQLNKIYKKYFVKDRPARTCIQVSRLPFDARVEIEAISSV